MRSFARIRGVWSVYSVWIKTWISRKHVIMKIDQTPSVWNGPVQRVAVEGSTRHTWVKGWDNFLWWSTCGLELSPTGTSLLYNVALASLQRHNFLQRCISVDGEALRYIDVEVTFFNVACPLRLYCDLKRFFFISFRSMLVGFELKGLPAHSMFVPSKDLTP